MEFRTFAEMLREKRESKGIKKTELAKRCEFSMPHLYSVEHGKNKPPIPARCEKIADVLELVGEERQSFLRMAQMERAPKELQSVLKQAIENPQIPVDATPVNSVDKIPLLGDCPCGAKTITDGEVEKWISFPREITKGRKLFLLRAVGDSMTGDGIHDQDVVIVNANAEPKNGDVIVARVDEECTIKRFYRYGDSIVLKPSNPAHQEIVIDHNHRFVYHGVVEGVLWKGLRKK